MRDSIPGPWDHTPELKADAQPLSPPGVPTHYDFKRYVLTEMESSS